MGNKENLEIINNILLKAPVKERDTTLDDLRYRENFLIIEHNKKLNHREIKKTGIVELMEIVRDAETVTLFDDVKAKIQLNDRWPEAVLIFNETGNQYGNSWDQVLAKFNLEDKLVIRGNKSVVVDDESNLVKIFGEALADPRRVFEQERGFAGRPL